MVDIISVVFRRFASQLHVSGDLRLSSDPESSALVLGDENIIRSLLFMSALTAASEMGMKVLFFTQNEIQSLPVNLQGTSSLSLKPDTLKKVKFVYPKTLEELLEDVASLHELVKEPSPLPSLLIIDGLERYICTQHRAQQDAQSMAAHILALLHDTSVFLTENLKTRIEENQTPCRIIVSCQPECLTQGGSDVFVMDSIISVLERYLQVKCSFEKIKSRVEGQNEWLLYLSGPGLQVNGDSIVENGLGLQWHVTLQPNKVLEFWPESAPNEEASHAQNTTDVNDD